MEITYLGHSSFKIKTTTGTVITDPYDSYVGFSMPGVSADVVTISHDHKDHNAVGQIKGTARRKNPFIIDSPGEYEIGGVSVFGVETYHDNSQGAERGPNTIYTLLMDGIRVCHLGDLGHELNQSMISQIGAVDVVLCPVGGVYTINPEQATKVIHALEPGYAIPMHFKTPNHEDKVFSELSTLEDFLKAYGAEAKPEAKLNIEPNRLPEETELVVLVNT